MKNLDTEIVAELKTQIDIILSLYGEQKAHPLLEAYRAVLSQYVTSTSYNYLEHRYKMGATLEGEIFALLYD